MSQLRCIIVDDEEGAHRVIEHYLQGIGTLSLAGNFYTAIEAMDFIYTNKVDLIFLDINMPGLSGLQMLEAMSDPPLVVVTTAYKEYALEGYKYQVVDYLVKPIELPRFMAAVDKVFSRCMYLTAHQSSTSPNKKGSKDYIILKINGDSIKVPCESILYFQSWGNYVKAYTKDAMLICQTTTLEIEQKLDNSLFARIHKSYIVSLQQVKKFTGSEVQLFNGVTLPVGNTFRRSLQDTFKK